MVSPISSSTIPDGRLEQVHFDLRRGVHLLSGQSVMGTGLEDLPSQVQRRRYGDLFLYNSTGQWGGALWFKLLGQPGNDFTYVAGDVRWAANWQVTPGDFDGDGFTDAVLYRTADGLAFRVKFTASSATYVSGQWGTTWTLHKGDFNGDKKTDLLFYDPSSIDGRWAVGLSSAAGDGSISTIRLPAPARVGRDHRPPERRRQVGRRLVSQLPTAPRGVVRDDAGHVQLPGWAEIQTGATLVVSPPTLP